MTEIDSREAFQMNKMDFLRREFPEYAWSTRHLDRRLRHLTSSTVIIAIIKQDVIWSYFLVNVALRAALFRTRSRRFKKTLGSPCRIALQ